MAKVLTGAGASAPEAENVVRADEDRVNTLYLALFLALLAFFILLTSLSSFEPVRTTTVLEAVGARFSSGASVENGSDAGASLPGTAPAGAVVLDDATYFDSIEISLAAFQLDGTARRSEGALSVMLPADRLFLPATGALKGAAVPALDALAQAVAAGALGAERRVEIDAGANVAGAGLAARRAAVLASSFSAYTGSEVIGIKVGARGDGMRNGEIRLVFYATGQKPGEVR